MVVRARDGSVKSYPVVETIHKNSILHVSGLVVRVRMGAARSRMLGVRRACWLPRAATGCNWVYTAVCR
jgi:hypothetical protein